jgi:hypothetical protein
MTLFGIIALTAASYAIGWALAIPVLVPLLNAFAAFPFMIDALRRRRVRLAVGRMLVWAGALAVCATLLSYWAPFRTDTLFVRGGAYRSEMFEWVRTGHGAESTPSQFIPEQAGHAAIFSLLAVGTGGAGALPMGAVLMNYMGHYVGTLAASSAHPLLTLVLAWHPWAVIRIVSFVVIGVVLAAPLLGQLGGFGVDWPASRRLLSLAVLGLVADVVLKTLLAPAWQRLLLHLVGWG